MLHTTGHSCFLLFHWFIFCLPLSVNIGSPRGKNYIWSFPKNVQLVAKLGTYVSLNNMIMKGNRKTGAISMCL